MSSSDASSPRHLLSPLIQPHRDRRAFNSDDEDLDLGGGSGTYGIELRDAATYNTLPPWPNPATAVDYFHDHAAQDGVVGWQSIQDFRMHLGEAVVASDGGGAALMDGPGQPKHGGSSEGRFGLLSDVYGNPHRWQATNDPLLAHLESDNEENDHEARLRPTPPSSDHLQRNTANADPSQIDSDWQRLATSRLFDDTDVAALATAPYELRARSYRDVPSAVFYLCALSSFSALGFYLFFATSSASLGKFLPKSFYAVFTDNLAIVAIAMALTFVLGALWLVVLQRHVRRLVQVQVVLVPVMAGACATWMLAEAFAAPIATLPGDASPAPVGPNPLYHATHLPVHLSMLRLIVGAAVTVLVTAGFSLYARLRWGQLDASISVLQLSLTILRDNPDLIAVGAVLNGVWILFVALWFIIASRIALLIHPALANIGLPGEWEPDMSAGYLSAFAMVMFIWTANLLDDVQRLTTAGVVSEWYFHRAERLPPQCGLAALALLRASTYQLGTCARAALNNSLAGLVRASTRIARRLIRHVPIVSAAAEIALHVAAGTPLRGWVMSAVSIQADAKRLSPAYAGMTGLGYSASVAAVARILRRNLILRFDLDYIARLVFWLSSVLVSAVVALAVYTSALSAATRWSQWDATLMAAVSGAAQFHVVRFYSRIVSSTTDAVFLCWSADIDQGKNRCDAAHLAFGPMQQPGRV